MQRITICKFYLYAACLIPISHDAVVAFTSSHRSVFFRGKIKKNNGIIFPAREISECISSTQKSHLSSLPQSVVAESAITYEKKMKNNGNKKNGHYLELNKDGSICILNGEASGDDGGVAPQQQPTVLFQGLDSSVWTAKRNNEGQKSRNSEDDNENENGIDVDVDIYDVDDDGIFLYAKDAEEKSAYNFALGDLVTCHRFLACARVSRYWMGPAFGKSSDELPYDTQFLLIEVKENGPYVLMLPLVDGGFRSSLCHNNEQGTQSSIDVVCHPENGIRTTTDDSVALSDEEMRLLYIATSDNPYDLIKKGFASVANATGTFKTLDNKSVPRSVNGFGFCTWDAFYSKVSPAGIIEGVKSLRKAGVPPKQIILDDGWQQVSPTAPPDEKSESSGTNNKADNYNNDKNILLSKFVDYLFNIFATGVTKMYQIFVQRAPHGSIQHKIWGVLSKTVLKQSLWSFFDSETDFARQLGGFSPNVKFQRSVKSSGDPADGITLKELVSELKNNLGVDFVYCWHALHGYWRGISPALGEQIGINVTNFHVKASDHVLRIEPQSAWEPAALFGVGLLSTRSDLDKFYSHLHEPLAAAGIDGVKVDVQSAVSSAGVDVSNGPHLAQMYNGAMEDSVVKHFPSGKDGAVNCINCMCHSTENLYRYKVTSVARASEDFFPRDPISQTVHIINVAYNSLFIGEICLPDWDMFHSKHASAELHAAARAIGGCPIYVSDVPGEHNADLLKKVVLPNGEILRAQFPGRPTRDCLFADVGTDKVSALKIWNLNSCGAGIVGAFHVQGVAWNFDTNENEVIHKSPPPITTTIKAYDVESFRDDGNGIEGRDEFVAWRYRSSTLEYLPSGTTPMKLNLKHSEWEIFTIVPIQKRGAIAWAPIGLTNMINSGGAIVQTGPLEGSSSFVTRGVIRTRGVGRFLVYCEPAPAKISSASTKDIPFSYDETTCKLFFDLPEKEDNNSDDLLDQITFTWDGLPIEEQNNNWQ